MVETNHPRLSIARQCELSVDGAVIVSTGRPVGRAS